LSTKSVISREVVVAAGAFAPGHLGELTQIVPFEMVDEALAQTGRTQERVRDLPSRVVVYLLLAGCLFPGAGWRQVWQRLTAGPEGLTVAAPTAGALAQARRRVGTEPLRWLFDLLRGPAAGIGTVGVWWRGLLVCAIDGTLMAVPDSPANQAEFTKHRCNNGEAGYPALRLLVLVSCGTRTVLDAVFGPTTDGETTYAPRLIRSLREGMIVLLDRNFAAQALVAKIAQTGAQVLVRDSRAASRWAADMPSPLMKITLLAWPPWLLLVVAAAAKAAGLATAVTAATVMLAAVTASSRPCLEERPMG
jgi:Insertion element 4 transposase N-terminal/Transposase DDE domain